MTDNRHAPVLLEETLEALNVRNDGIYVDATFGRGGHSAAILEHLGPAGRVLALDRDPQAVAAAQQRFAADARFVIVQTDFAQLQQVVENHNMKGKINGVLLDLGVSSPQLEQAQRGFSFKQLGPLDMRMDPNASLTAALWLAQASEQEIAQVIREYGEERYARRIAKAIIRRREVQSIDTTADLAALVAQAVPTREPGKDPATRTFQAIRMHINQELPQLQAVLPQTLDVLAVGGRLVVISFHSLEDRIVKQFMRKQAKGDEFPPDLPIPYATLSPTLKVIGKPIKPSSTEVQLNPRARSAILRVAQRLEVSHA